MGSTKRLLDDYEAMRTAALTIAIKAGVLGACEFHDDGIYQTGEEIEGAYKLGNAQFTAGELGDVFPARRDMTDAIKAVVEDHPAEECTRCAKMRDED